MKVSQYASQAMRGSQTHVFAKPELGTIVSPSSQHHVVRWPTFLNAFQQHRPCRSNPVLLTQFKVICTLLHYIGP